MTDNNESNRPSSLSEQGKDLPVIIAGAGPCGLVAALSLKRHDVPFLLVERAERSKLCADVGSGYDLAPTAIHLLKHQLGIPPDDVDRAFQRYAGMHVCDMSGDVVRDLRMSDVSRGTEVYEALTAGRSEMQRLLVDNLLGDGGTAGGKDDEEDVLRCGVAVTGYSETVDGEKEGSGSVSVTLSDGSTVEGRALLGCDGIRSAVRKCMMSSEQVSDELHYCNINCWWGKVEIEPDSELDRALQATQKYNKRGGSGDDGDDDVGASFVWMLGSSDMPGSFMCGPSFIAGGRTLLIWAFFAEASTPPDRSDDLTRRGGVTLDEASKDAVMDIVRDRGTLVRLAVEATAPENITCVGLFDRGDMKGNLPYARGRVFLLGDAAHAQSPFMGQGVNMAIADAYVCATRLAHVYSTGSASGDGVANQLQSYDSKSRRRGVNKVVQQARTYGDISVSSGRFKTWAFAAAMRYLPPSWFIGDMLEGDRSNADFVREVHSDLGIE